MSTIELMLGLVMLATLVAIALLAILLGRRPERVEPLLEGHAQAVERLARELRAEVLEQARANRSEIAESIGRLAQQVTGQAGTVARIQNAQIDGFAQQLARLAESNETRLGEIRRTLDERLRELQRDNGTRLDEMRRTVDEKLHATLEQRLGESFRLVSERLEQVHRGLGEMHALATDVGDLRRVLTNVKTRGIWGEMQLAALLSQMLAPDQYAANVATVPGSADRVEFAIRLPGRDGDAGVWLPIDAKFPREDYERLQQAHERADADAAEAACRALEARVRAEARSIRDKYLAPPHTTDFAVLFLPTEGLYGEIVRRPGLAESLQRECRVAVAGPATLAALLNSLQMGFRTLAIEQRSSEVWRLLGAVKGEFGKFGDVLARTRQQLETATRTIGQAEVRTRAIERQLRDVESLPDGEARILLDVQRDAAEAPDPSPGDPSRGDPSPSPPDPPGPADPGARPQP